MLAAVLGHLYLGQWREARSMLRLALKNDPENQDLQKLRKRVWKYRLRRYLRVALSPFRRANGRRMI
jgi:hypothetical protein